MNVDSVSDWYSNVEDNEDTCSSVNSQYLDTLSSLSSHSPSPAHEPPAEWRSTPGPVNTGSSHTPAVRPQRSNGRCVYSSTKRPNGHPAAPPRQLHSNTVQSQPIYSDLQHVGDVQPVSIGNGIYYYGEIGPRSAPCSPAPPRTPHNYAPSNLTNGISASRHSHNRAGSAKQYQYTQYHSNVNSQQHTGNGGYTSHNTPAVHFSHHKDHISLSQLPSNSKSSSKSRSSSKQTAVSCYSAFSIGSQSTKKHKLPKVFRRSRTKSEKSGSKSKSKRNSPSHTSSLSVHGSTSVHPRRNHGYLSDCEGYRHSRRKKGLLEPSEKQRLKQSSSHGLGYSSDYEVVRQHKHLLQLEARSAKGYSSGYETTGSFFSGSEWSEDESVENEFVFSDNFTTIPRRGSRTKSAGTIVLHKIAKKFGKMSGKSGGGGDGGEGSDGSGGGGASSWSAKKAAKKKKKTVRSNSVSNLADADE